MPKRGRNGQAVPDGPEPANLLNSLPMELIERISQFLPTTDLCRFRATCRRVRNATSLRRDAWRAERAQWKTTVAYIRYQLFLGNPSFAGLPTVRSLSISVFDNQRLTARYFSCIYKKEIGLNWSIVFPDLDLSDLLRNHVVLRVNNVCINFGKNDLNLDGYCIFKFVSDGKCPLKCSTNAFRGLRPELIEEIFVVMALAFRIQFELFSFQDGGSAYPVYEMAWPLSKNQCISTRAWIESGLRYNSILFRRSRGYETI